MQRRDVYAALNQIKAARQEWAKAQTEFTAEIDRAMTRLIPEAAANFLSVEEVSRETGMAKPRVRKMMIDAGFNPRNGRQFLALHAAQALRTNSDLLGIDPSEMDLTSPLAYLPMGEEMRARLEAEREYDPCPHCGAEQPEQAEQ